MFCRFIECLICQKAFSDQLHLKTYLECLGCNNNITFSFHQVTTLDQRLVQLDVQPVSSKDLFPRHKYLMIKRSQRCRKCEHNLSKPEYNPTSIKFKIQLAAYYHIPEGTIHILRNHFRIGVVQCVCGKNVVLFRLEVYPLARES